MRRTTESNLRKRERRLARISLLIVFIFIICHSVKNIPTMFEILGHDPRVICLEAILTIKCSQGSPCLLSAAPHWSPPSNYQQQCQLSCLLSWQLQEGCQTPPQPVWCQDSPDGSLSPLRSPDNQQSEQWDWHVSCCQGDSVWGETGGGGWREGAEEGRAGEGPELGLLI